MKDRFPYFSEGWLYIKCSDWPRMLDDGRYVNEIEAQFGMDIYEIDTVPDVYLSE